MGTLGRRRTSCGHSCAGTWMLLTLCLSHGGLSPRSQEVFGSEKIQTKQLISHVRKLTTQGHETNSGPSPPAPNPGAASFPRCLSGHVAFQARPSPDGSALVPDI